MGHTISIAGYPLATPVTLTNVARDCFIEDESWLLTRDQASILLNAWKEAPAADTDVIREWERFEIGLIATALTMDGTTNISGWEAADRSDGSDTYSTANMPFDFTIAASTVEPNNRDQSIENRES